jgi:hypothetical protein
MHSAVSNWKILPTAASRYDPPVIYSLYALCANIA